MSSTSSIQQDGSNCQFVNNALLKIREGTNVERLTVAFGYQKFAPQGATQEQVTQAVAAFFRDSNHSLRQSETYKTLQRATEGDISSLEKVIEWIDPEDLKRQQNVIGSLLSPSSLSGRLKQGLLQVYPTVMKVAKVLAVGAVIAAGMKYAPSWTSEAPQTLSAISAPLLGTCPASNVSSRSECPAPKPILESAIAPNRTNISTLPSGQGPVVGLSVPQNITLPVPPSVAPKAPLPAQQAKEPLWEKAWKKVVFQKKSQYFARFTQWVPRSSYTWPRWVHSSPAAATPVTTLPSEPTPPPVVLLTKWCQKQILDETASGPQPLDQECRVCYSDVKKEGFLGKWRSPLTVAAIFGMAGIAIHSPRRAGKAVWQTLRIAGSATPGVARLLYKGGVGAVKLSCKVVSAVCRRQDAP